MNKQLNYKNSGVDVDANAAWTKWIAETVKEDRQKHNISHVSPIGGFAGALNLPEKVKEKIARAVMLKYGSALKSLPAERAVFSALKSFSLVACTDGVGTKTMIAEQLNRLDTLGYDLLAMNVNDMVAGGATPIAFLDYIGCKGIMENGVYRYQPFVEGLIKACREIDVELVGGETAEMRDNYTQFGSDLTGFALGVVTPGDIPKSDTIEKGDVIFALGSSGLHSNGYSLVRKILEEFDISLDDKPDEFEGQTVADVLLTPTRLYVKQALAANATGYVKAMAHITGGGLVENIERVLPKDKNLKVRLYNPIYNNGANPPVFDWIQKMGIGENVMLKTFNMGYGFVFIAKSDYCQQLLDAVNEPLFLIGDITSE